jgi:tripartite-type tricarboxylate transporter receptor subunit TctC
MQLVLTFISAVILAASPLAAAQTYPSRPVTPILVENVTGADGSIGSARAAPDGHTVVLGNWTSHVGTPALYPLQHDVLKDFEPVARLPVSRLWITGKVGLPAKDARELIAWLKTHPNKASFATVGAGSAVHMCGIYLQNSTGNRFQFVPYRGAAPAYQDLMAGNEVGVAGMDLTFWNGLWAPRGTPKEAIAKLHLAVADAFADAGMRQKVADLGQEILPRGEQTPEALGAHHKAETGKWWPIIKAAGVKPD